MKKIIVLALAAVLAAPFIRAQETYTPAPENIEARKEFAKHRFGIFIHWGIYSMMADGEWIMNSRDLKYDEYSRLAAGFYPSKFNAEEWVKVFKAAGAKYITITSRHHDGFSMFGTKASPYNIVDATPFKRDVIKELSEACAKEGIKLHFYYSHLDWGRNDYFPLGNTGHSAGRPEGDDTSWNHYIDFMCTQLSELLTNYGPIEGLWFDGVWDKRGKDFEEQGKIWQIEKQYKLIHSLQPACIIGNNHHHGNFAGEDMQIFEKDLPGKNTTGFVEDSVVSDTLPLETCETINNSWGYSMDDDSYKSKEDLIRYLVKAAGNGANFLLNIGPRPDGTLPEESVERLLAIGQWLEKYGESVYETQRGCTGEMPWGITTQKDNVLYIHNFSNCGAVLVPVKGNKAVSAVCLQGGEKVTFKQVDEGIVVSFPACTGDCPDRIVKVTFKKDLN